MVFVIEDDISSNARHSMKSLQIFNATTDEKIVWILLRKSISWKEDEQPIYDDDNAAAADAAAAS